MSNACLVSIHAPSGIYGIYGIYGWMVDSFLDNVGLEPVNFGGPEQRSAYWPGETKPC